MGKVLFGIIVAVASLMLVDSLTCNKCSFSLVGVCVNSGEITCSDNSSVCYTGKATFSSLPSFTGFTTQGCRANDTSCNASSNSTLLGVTYETKIECCSTDKCNPIQLSGAPSTKMTFSVAIAAAMLASMWGSIQ